MSELKVDQVSSRTGGYLAINTLSHKNLIINGDQSISQRGTSQASITAAGYYTIDRWRTDVVTAGTWTQTQSTEVPTGQGFANSMKLDCTTADGSLAAGDRVFYGQRIEDQNCTYLKKGTSSAESTTVSFWVKSNKTGIYICELFDSHNSRQINKSYTINSADTWEKKTITYPGDTSGAFANDNGIGLMLQFWLAAGSTYTSGTLSTSWQASNNADRAVGQVNLADNTANEWLITGVQLEANTVASSFNFEPYDVNLRRCQRYYYLLYRKEDSTANNGCSLGIYGIYYTNTNVFFVGSHPVAMRANPSLDMASGTNYYRLYRAGALDNFDDFTLQTTSNRTNRYSWEANNSTDVSGTAGQTGILRGNINTYVGFDAEL